MEERIDKLNNFMNISTKKLFLGILAIGLIANFIVLFDIQYFYLRAIFSFIFLTTIPGLLIMSMLKIRKIEFWEYLVYTIGLSIVFLMFVGLAVNWTFPLLHITDKPLSLTPLLISFDILLLIFGIIDYVRNRDLRLKIKFPKMGWLNKIFFAIPIIFPVLSILGATTLNNGGSNTITMFLLFAIAVYIFSVVLLRKRVDNYIFPFSIFCISISILLTTSMRGWILSGHDVISEYHVFQLTKFHFHWSMSYLKDPYNACLSITILPTIFSSFLHVNDYYIYKFFFQIISAIISVNIFFFLRKFTTNINAYLASFFFASQFVFLGDYAFLIRQEIATVFFTLGFVVLFNRKIPIIKRNFMFIFFAFSMVVSHYSTTYIALGLFSFTYLIYFMFRKLLGTDKLNKNIPTALKEATLDEHNLSLVILLSVFLFAFVWYSQVTKTSNNIEGFISKTYKNMGQLFKQDAHMGQTSFVDQFNLFYKPNEKDLFKKYKENVEKIYSEDPYIIQYPKNIRDKYLIHILSTEKIPLHISTQVEKVINLISEIDKKIVKLFILIGIISFIVIRKRQDKINLEYFSLILASLAIIFGIILIPYATIDYNLIRTYQQLLIFLSLPVIMGSFLFFSFIKERIRIFVVVAILLLYFLSYSGFIPQLTGGEVGDLHLNNLGLYYDEYLNHSQELLAGLWLNKNYNHANYIYTDNINADKLVAFSGFDGNGFKLDVLPATIDKNSYVVMSYTNVFKNEMIKYYNGESIFYSYPTKFIKDNKNLLYNNGGSEIYK